MRKTITSALAVLALAGPALAQQPNPGGQTAFSLDQAVSYAIQNSIQIRNANTDYLSSKAKVGEVRSIGLPQITGSASYNFNAIIQRSPLELGKGAAAFFSQGVQLPQQLVGLPIGLGFALPHSLSGGLQLNQLIFSPSYLLGLKAASVYTDLSRKELDKARIDTKAQVTKAYYQAMVGQEQAKLLDYNIARLDTSLFNTQAYFKNGFAEQIDVYRLEVQRNNLLADRETIARQIQLAISALKFAMQYPISQPLTITDQLSAVQIDAATQAEAYGNYEQRIDYSILNTQEALAKLDLKNQRAGYIPTLSGFASLGVNSASTRFIDMLPPYTPLSPGGPRGQGLQGWYDPVTVTGSDGTVTEIYSGGQRWYGSSILGVSLNVPIFDGFSKYYKIQQSRLTLKKIQDSRELLKNSIDFEIDRANIAGQNARARLQTQERNLNLAKEVVRVTRIKYQQGVGASLEVTNAETDLRVAQTNYYAALYDALVAKVDADVAAGRITAQ